MNTIHLSKRIRNAGSKNPKKNPTMRRDRSTDVRQRVAMFAMKPKRDALGKPIPLNGSAASGGFKMVRFWPGRNPSKFDPQAEDLKHGGRQ